MPSNGKLSGRSSGKSTGTRGKLSHIKTGTFSRGLALARVSLSASARAASHAIGNVFADEGKKADNLKELLISQLNHLTRELGELKGSLMKVGQMLSMYGEHFLPPEANALLKSLQSQSPPLEWSVLEKVICKQLPPERLSLLEIDHEPLASASLGQVYRARRISDGRMLAMKVQYPGVDRAIEGDLKALRSILSLIRLVPKGPKYDELFKEVRSMLHQEINYAYELETTQEFKKALEGDSRFIVPEVFPEFSTKRILTTSLEEGIPVDSPEVLELSQERRNALGIAIMDLYFQEIFHLRAVQTDPHFGNYRVRLGDPSGTPEQALDRLVLLDFGAVRRIPQPFWGNYLELVVGAHLRDSNRILQAAQRIGFVDESDGDELKKHFVELCYLITEPFYSPDSAASSQSLPEDFPRDLFDSNGAYLFDKSDLPKRVAKKAAILAVSFKFRSPPREIVFLDRKLGGVFIFLSVLKVQVRARDVIQKYLESYLKK